MEYYLERAKLSPDLLSSPSVRTAVNFFNKYSSYLKIPVVLIGGVIGVKIGYWIYEPTCLRRYMDMQESKHGAYFFALRAAHERKKRLLVTPDGIFLK